MDNITMWAMFMRAQSLSRRTIDERVSVTKRLVTDSGRDLPDIQPPDIAAWLGDLDVSATTRATYHGHLRAAFAWARTVGLVQVSPMDAVPKSRRPRSVPRPIESSQLDALLTACNRRKTRMMVHLALFAGLRVHEIAKIRGEDVDLDARTLYVDGKGGTRAIIPLHDRIASEARTFPNRGHWFPSKAGGHVHSGSVSQVVGRTMRRAGISGTAHQLRHWYGTALLDAGTDVRVVQELMRHQSIQSTTIYTRVSDTQRRTAIGRLAA